jgi:curved DNA-binding protein CbpA
VIGADPAATAAELRRAYLRRARTLHPDQSGDTAGMQELNAAWEVLGDPTARAAYDRQRAPAPAPEPAPEPGPEAEPEWEPEPFDPVAAFLRALPVLAVLFVLFVVFVFTAYAGGRGSSGDGVDGPTTVSGPTAPVG